MVVVADKKVARAEAKGAVVFGDLGVEVVKVKRVARAKMVEDHT